MEQKEAKPKIDIKAVLESLSVGKEEAIAKAIGELTDEEKLDFITYLYPLEDDNLALLRTIAYRYNYQWLNIWVENKLKLRTSLMGWRGNQLTNIASEKRKEEGRFGFISRLFKRKEKMGEVESFE